MTNMYRLPDDAGQAIEITETDMLDDTRFKLIEPDPNDYVKVPSGTKARLRLSGISEFFEMTGQYGTSTNIRVEFLILKATGSNQLQREIVGKRFTQLMTPKLGAKSKLGALYGKLRERDVERDETIDIMAYIGTEFVATVYENERGYADIEVKSIEKGKTVLSPLLGESTPASPNGAAKSVGAATEVDPFAEGFEGDDDDTL